MSGQALDLASERIDNKLNVLCRNSFYSFLDHVVPILVFNALEDIVLKFLDKLSLLIRQDVFKSLKNC